MHQRLSCIAQEADQVTIFDRQSYWAGEYLALLPEVITAPVYWWLPLREVNSPRRLMHLIAYDALRSYVHEESRPQ